MIKTVIVCSIQEPLVFVVFFGDGMLLWLQIKGYVDGRGRDVPLILLGGPGTGKSSIMARAVDATLTAAIDRKYPGEYLEHTQKLVHSNGSRNGLFTFLVWISVPKMGTVMIRDSDQNLSPTLYNVLHSTM